MNLSGRMVIYDRILIVGFQISDFRSRDIGQAKTEQPTTGKAKQTTTGRQSRQQQAGRTDNDRQAEQTTEQINKTEI